MAIVLVCPCSEEIKKPRRCWSTPRPGPKEDDPLIDQSVAPAAQETNPEYVWRGRGLFETYRDELEYLGSGKWLIPSGTKPGLKYEVRAGVRSESCECVGYSRRGHCSHIVCVIIARKKSGVCDSCGVRRWNRELVEVQDDDGLLSWYPGDRICKRCIDDGAW